VITTTFLQVVSGVIVGIQVILTQRLISAVLAAGNGHGYGMAAAYLAGLVGGQTLVTGIGIISDQQQQLLTELVARGVLGPVLEVTARMELRELEDPKIQDQVSRVTGTAAYRPQQLVSSFVSLLRGFFQIAGVSAALFSIQPLLVGALALGMLPAWYFNQKVSESRYGFYQEAAPFDRIRTYIIQLMTHLVYAKEVRAFELAKHLRERFLAVSDERLTILRRYMAKQRNLFAWATIGNMLFSAIALGFLGWMLVSNKIGVAAAGATVQGALALAASLTGVTSSAATVYEAGMFLEDLESFVDRRGAVSAPVSKTPLKGFNKIALSKVDFTYPSSLASDPSLLAALTPGELKSFGMARPGPPPGSLAPTPKHALKGVSLEIKRGEVIALVGENGSGKTTLAKILGGLYAPDSGGVIWDGIDIATVDPERGRSQVAVVFQDFAHYMLTARENIGFGRVDRLDDVERIHWAAVQAGAHPFISIWPEGYDSYLGPMFYGGRDVSIGQWQRIAIARAFFRDAPLVILDEPTASLDARAEHDLFQRIRSLFANRSVLLISHRFSSVYLADRIYVLKDGSVVEHGTHSELLSARGLYAELFGLQAEAYAARNSFS
jgi:ATP-binding cassette subfamily B protein